MSNQEQARKRRESQEILARARVARAERAPEMNAEARALMARFLSDTPPVKAGFGARVDVISGTPTNLFPGAAVPKRFILSEQDIAEASVMAAVMESEEAAMECLEGLLGDDIAPGSNRTASPACAESDVVGAGAMPSALPLFGLHGQLIERGEVRLSREPPSSS